MKSYPVMTNEQYREELASIFSLITENNTLAYFYVYVCEVLNILPEGGEEE